MSTLLKALFLFKLFPSYEYAIKSLILHMYMYEAIL